MILRIKIECKTLPEIVKELKDIFDDLESETKPPCKGCKQKAICVVGGGSDNSTWSLKRHGTSHQYEQETTLRIS